MRDPGVGTNRYAYSANDPINKSDPNGHMGEACAIGAAATIETGPGALGGCVAAEAAFWIAVAVLAVAAKVIDVVANSEDDPKEKLDNPGSAENANDKAKDGSHVVEPEAKPLSEVLKGIRAREKLFEKATDIGDKVGWPLSADELEESLSKIDDTKIEEIQKSGITKGDVENMRDGYGKAIEKKKGDDVAKARKRYLEELIDKWKDDDRKD